MGCSGVVDVVLLLEDKMRRSWAVESRKREAKRCGGGWSLVMRGSKWR